ncbi:MAG TPA: STAS domain-containing protein [Streptosporangiaceae bacterium]|nr:STAS domain-containing protein [Streptosporangiaceae bacterium]
MADDVLRITRASDGLGLIIAGEIDESSYPRLVRGLATLNPRGAVHIDLAGVIFCDLAGLRAIVCAAEPETGDSARGHLTLHAVPHRLRRILEILGWDDMPGVGFADERLPTGHEQHAGQ